MILYLLAALQIQIGSLQGKIVDPSGGAVQGARVLVVDALRERAVESDESGRFHFNNLPYGRYRVWIVALAYNFSNPFSGTHFGHPRLFSVRVKLTFPG